MEMVFFLSALPDDLYKLVTEVLDMYGKLELKGQKAKKRDLRTRMKSTVDCSAYNFKCLRGDLTDTEIRGLLQDLVKKTLTFNELKIEASRIKEVKEVQRHFVTKTGSKHWEEVIEG